MLEQTIHGFSILGRPITIARVGDWLEFTSGSYLLAAKVAAIAHVEKARLWQWPFLVVGLAFLAAGLYIKRYGDNYAWYYLSASAYATIGLLLGVLCLVIFAVWRPHFLVIGLASGKDIKLSGPSDTGAVEQVIGLFKKAP